MYGYGRGAGLRRGPGAGYGFRGFSPPWPYYGRGRGGLPRCAYPGLRSGAVIPFAYDNEEREALQGQADMMRRQLEDIERRIKELENKD
jgi:hypothetical protein